jgi:hypothetical protein
VNEGAFARTKTGDCIADVFQEIRIAPFNLDRVTMSQVVGID